MQIRRATAAADAETLAALSIETFTETFGHMYAADDLRDYLRDTYAAELYRDGLDEQGNAAWLLENDAGKATGYAYAGPAKLPHATVQAGDMELKRLYLLSSAQNGGWGAKLFAQAEAWMRANGPTSIWIGVWSGNEGAQRFYARHGYAKVGEYLYPVGEARDLEFILRKPI